MKPKKHIFVVNPIAGGGTDVPALRRKVEDEDETSFGLVAASKRLKLMYPDACSFEIESSAGFGTSITIRFPMQAKEEARHA